MCWDDCNDGGDSFVNSTFFCVINVHVCQDPHSAVSAVFRLNRKDQVAKNMSTTDQDTGIDVVTAGLSASLKYICLDAANLPMYGRELSLLQPHRRLCGTRANHHTVITVAACAVNLAALSVWGVARLHRQRLLGKYADADWTGYLAEKRALKASKRSQSVVKGFRKRTFRKRA